MLRSAVRRLLLSSAASFATLSGGASVHAANLQWDANGAAGGSGGTGVWNTLNLNWFNGLTYQAWNNGAVDDAAFGGTAGTVTLGGAITVHNVSFATTGYVLGSGTLALSGVAPVIGVTSGSATIGSQMLGANGMTKTGTGSLTLTGDSSYIGGTTIAAGSLIIGNGGTAGSIIGNVVDNGGLTFNRSDSLSFGGTISGTGSLTKQG